MAGGVRTSDKDDRIPGTDILCRQISYPYLRTTESNTLRHGHRQAGTNLALPGAGVYDTAAHMQNVQQQVTDTTGTGGRKDEGHGVVVRNMLQHHALKLHSANDG
eukprot:773443-Rhodomonas_salina.1